MLNETFFEWSLSQKERERCATVFGLITTHSATELTYDGNERRHIWFLYEGKVAHMQSNMLCVDWPNEPPEKTIERIEANNISRAKALAERDALDAIETEASAILLKVFPGDDLPSRRARAYVRNHLDAKDIIRAEKEGVSGLRAAGSFWRSKTAQNFISFVRGA